LEYLSWFMQSAEALEAWHHLGTASNGA